MPGCLGAVGVSVHWQVLQLTVKKARQLALPVLAVEAPVTVVVNGPRPRRPRAGVPQAAQLGHLPLGLGPIGCQCRSELVEMDFTPGTLVPLKVKFSFGSPDYNSPV